MAVDVERLVLEMDANVRKFENALNRSNQLSDRRLTSIERRFAQSERKVSRSAGAMADNVRNAIAGIAVAAAIREVAQYADAWTLAENKLASAGVASDRLAATQARLVDLALETRTSLSSTVDLYSRLTRSTSELGVSQEAVARATEIAQKAFKSSGQTTAEATSSVIQLGQALGSGALQGDELRAIRENSITLAQAIAREFGVSVGELKKLGEEGELTSDRVFSAILKAGGQIDAQFAKTNGTIEDSFTNLQTRFTQYIAQVDDATDASEKVAGFINSISQNFEAMGDAALIAATIIGGTFAGQAVASAITAMRAATVAAGFTTATIAAMGRQAAASAAAMNVLRGSMAFFGGPVGLAITAIVTAVGLLAIASSRAVKPSKELEASTTALDKALRAYEDAAVAASIATGKDRESALEAVNAKRALAEMAKEAAAAQLAQAQATLALVRAQNAEAIANDQFNFRGDRPGTIRPTLNEPRRRQAAADAKAAAEAIAEAEAGIARIDELLNRPLTSGGGGSSGDDKAAGKARDLATRQAALLVDLREEQAIAEAQARGDLDRTRELERQADIRARTLDYEDAGLATAAARAQAEKDIADLEDARTVGLERQVLASKQAYEIELARIREDAEALRDLERAEELRERIVTHQENGLDLANATALAEREIASLEQARADARDRLLETARREHDLQVAYLLGDERRIRALEREAELLERTRRYREEGGLSADQAQARAAVELEELDEAELRGKFRAAFGDGVRAALAGDLGEAAEEWAKAFGDKLVRAASDQLADLLFDQLVSFFPDLMGELARNGGDLAAAATMSTAITTASATGAATLGATITTSTTTGAAAMAASVTTSGASAAAAIGVAILGAGQAAAAAMGAAIAAASGASSAGGVAAAFSQAAGAFHNADGGALVRGRRNIINERGPEPIVPTMHAVAFSTAAMKGLSDLGDLARKGMFGQSSAPAITVNNYGEPAAVSMERSPSGDVKLDLRPIMEGGIEGAGSSGKLRKALAKSPTAKRRG